MTAPQVTGQLELDYDAAELTAEQRAALASHVVAGWQTKARCVEQPGETRFRLNPNNWFPELTDTHARRTAFAWCYDCPARRSCLAFALSSGEEYGIWAGTTEFQRYDLLALIAGGARVTDVLDSGLAAARDAFYVADRADALESPRSEDAEDDGWVWVA